VGLDVIGVLDCNITPFLISISLFPIISTSTYITKLINKYTYLFTIIYIIRLPLSLPL
jgi:hypothetical protein